MRIEFDPAKRRLTLAERGLDRTDAGDVFDGETLTIVDDRQDYGEACSITIGLLAGRMVVLVWTPRGAARRIISLRKANAKEQRRHGGRFR